MSKLERADYRVQLLELWGHGKKDKMAMATDPVIVKYSHVKKIKKLSKPVNTYT